MDPLDALTGTPRSKAPADNAAAAASWLNNPASVEPRKSFAQLLADEPEWIGPTAQESPNQ